MPKEYYCKQLKGFFTCGETEPSKFEKGRYTTCRECRKNFMKEYNKEQREEIRKDKEMEVIDKIDSNKGDLGKNMQTLIVNTIQDFPVYEGYTILEKIEKREFIMSDFTNNLQLKHENYNKNINNIIKENESLKREIESLRNEIIQIKSILQNKNIYDFENY